MALATTHLTQGSGLTLIAKIRPLTPSQRARAAWEGLSETDRAAWQIYAQRLKRFDPARRKITGPSARQAFVQLMTLAWKLDSGLTVLTQPPKSGYLGEDAAIVVQNTTQGLPRRKGHLRLVATAPLGTDVVVEVVAHRMQSEDEPIRTGRTKHLGFFTFSGDRTLLDIPMPKGGYGVSYRTIRVNTLQTSPWVAAGIGLVGVRLPKSLPAATVLAVVESPEPNVLRERLLDPVTPIFAVVSPMPDRDLLPR